MTPAGPVPAAAQRRRLPITLYILAGVMTFKAALLLTVAAGLGLAFFRPVVGLSTTPGLVEALQASAAASALLVLAAILVLVSVIGMLSRKRIGWLLAMVVTGLFVALDIYAYALGTANHVWMALNIVTVFYLNQRDVREVVGAARSPAAEPAEADGVVL